MASAKFANRTVNHSHTVICRSKLNPRLWCVISPMSSSEVTTLPTSTTNMTGLPIILRGLSFTIESQIALRTIFHSQTALDLLIDASEALSGGHHQVLEDRSETECWEKGQRTDDENGSNQQHSEQW